jgi:hypothetical protein
MTRSDRREPFSRTDALIMIRTTSFKLTSNGSSARHLSGWVATSRLAAAAAKYGRRCAALRAGGIGGAEFGAVVPVHMPHDLLVFQTPVLVAKTKAKTQLCQRVRPGSVQRRAGGAAESARGRAAVPHRYRAVSAADRSQGHAGAGVAERGVRRGAPAGLGWTEM